MSNESNIDRVQYEIAVYGKIPITTIKRWTQLLYSKAITTPHSNSLCVLIGLESIRGKIQTGINEDEIDSQWSEIVAFMD